MDGDGFSMTYYFSDGNNCSAHGSNAYPEGYGIFKGSVDGLFRPLVEKLKEDARAAVIEKGITGKASSAMVNFMQRGDSGSDKYEFYMYKTDRKDSNNFDLQILSDSGEFIEEGKYSIYGHLNGEDFDLSWLDELVEKYELIKWYDYDETAEDYNNEEWFQISIGFDGDEPLNISAMGTKHPENYDAFREEFIVKMLEYYRSVEDKIVHN